MNADRAVGDTSAVMGLMALVQGEDMYAANF
jgi:hypothetical protein